MADLASTQWTPQMDADSEKLINALLAEMQQLNAQMRQDQAEIDRLKMETRALSERTDTLLRQIEAQLDALQKAA